MNMNHQSVQTLSPRSLSPYSLGQQDPELRQRQGGRP